MNPSRRFIDRRRTTLSLIAAFALLPGCERQSDSVIDPPLAKPFLVTGTVTPDTLRTSALPQAGGIVSGTLTVRAAVSMPAGSQPLVSVHAQLIDPSNNAPLTSTILTYDNSVTDTSSGYLHVMGTLNFAVPKSTTGRYAVKISTSTESGDGANVVECSTYFLRDNRPPILSNLIMPDTVSVPAGGSTDFAAKLTVSDPDGQTDIAQVFFLNLDSSDPTHRYRLYDDGSNNSNSGDAVEGDGIFTITLTTPASAKGKVYRFLYQATDAFGDTSASLLHYLTIK